jgi:lipopolysaccharide assembly protein A
MRWLHLIIIGLFFAALLIFAGQNFETVTMTFLGFSARAPLALLAVIFYLLGMVTGGSLWSLLRRSMQGARGTS